MYCLEIIKLKTDKKMKKIITWQLFCIFLILKILRVNIICIKIYTEPKIQQVDILSLVPLCDIDT